MTSRDFCYWLQGFFEIQAAGLPSQRDAGLEADQVKMIKAHLDMVFAHEIDPSMGSKEHQDLLTRIHETAKSAEKKAAQALSAAQHANDRNRPITC
jgi:hypothetical protein